MMLMKKYGLNQSSSIWFKEDLPFKMQKNIWIIPEDLSIANLLNTVSQNTYRKKAQTKTSDNITFLLWVIPKLKKILNSMLY